MKIIILGLAIISFSVSAKADTLELIKLNEATFTEKELRTKPDLCNFHRELQVKAKIKPIECPRNEGSQTRDAEVAKQLQIAQELALLPTQSEPGVNEMIVNLPHRKLRPTR